jgi:hypothetical protein
MSDRAIQTAVEKLAGTFKKDTVEMLVGTVKSVDESKSTCTVVIENGVELPNVLLQAGVCDGLQVIPKKDSGVVVIKSTYNQPFIAVYSDVEKYYLQVGDGSLTVFKDTSNNQPLIQLNDGSYGGLIKIQELVNKINAIENLLNGFITIYNTHAHTATSLGSPTTVPSSVETQTISPITQKSDIENTKVNHGA